VRGEPTGSGEWVELVEDWDLCSGSPVVLQAYGDSVGIRSVSLRFVAVPITLMKHLDGIGYTEAFV
jgi:hypothetical protein